MRTLIDVQAALERLNVNLVVKDMKLLAQGFSSDNYLICSNAQQYVLKFAHQPLIASQVDVQETLYALAITPKVYALDIAQGIQLSEYWPAESPCSANNINVLSRLLSRLHPIKHNSQCMNFKQKFAQYHVLPEYEEHKHFIANLLHQLAAFQANIGFCHNDLVLENMLQYQGRVKLIDFEYAGNNDVFFDLASISSSLMLSVKEKTQLLTTYIESSGLKISLVAAQEKLNYFQLAYDFLCYFWYIDHQQPKLAQQVLALLILPKLK